MSLNLDTVIAVMGIVWMCYLCVESLQLKRARKSLDHVVHVNGTRGKSTVSRLIEAGLREGGFRVFCKTTGTDPMIIDVSGMEYPIHRCGRANIKEQIRVLRQAARQNAQILVVECMAVQPELQYVAQHRILTADVGVLTNVRRDHADIMGHSLHQICEALSNTIPKHGVLFTADAEAAYDLEKRAEKLGSEFHLIQPNGTEPEGEFPENTALALAVCTALGVDRSLALEGMSHYHPDPYRLSVHALGEGIFINGLSINDLQSILIVKDRVWEEQDLDGQRLILLINNRADRGTRTKDMLEVCQMLQPQEIWLIGASQWYMRRGLSRILSNTSVKGWKKAKDLPLNQLKNEVIFAIGNIAGEGRCIMSRVREEGTEIV